MLNKRVIFVFLLLIISICTLSAVSANDSADDVINGTLEEIDELDECGADFDSIEIQDNGILANSDDGTFTSLQKKINEAAEGSTITLENDYYYNSNFESKNGVKITKSLTINGNGHVIDGMSKSSLFQVNDTKKVILNNITFKNGIKKDNKLVDVSHTDYFKLDACNFVNNEGTVGGGVCISYVNTTSIVHCVFVNNKAVNNGGAIAISNVNNSYLMGNSFVDNDANGYRGSGGAVSFIYVNHSSVINCSFKGNMGGIGGAIVLEYVDNFSFEQCRFEYNVGRQGGAILFDCCVFSYFHSCNFLNNSAEDGAAVFSYVINDFSFDNCSFENNNASKSGGAIFSRYANRYSFAQCSFEKNQANSGGAICLADSNCYMDSCSFLNNSAQAGGAIFSRNADDVQVTHCNFYINHAIVFGGSIFCINSKMDLKNSKINISISSSFGGSIAANHSDVTIDNCLFEYGVSLRDAGGGIYSFQGNLSVGNASFIECGSRFGGSICSLDSNLNVSSSNFIDSGSYYGGAIYVGYGKIFVNDSFFKNSFALTRGGAIYSMMSDSLTITNNIFLNSTAYKSFSPCIDIICPPAKNIVESNHFEDVYHLYLEYGGYINGERFTVKSRVLNYVLSNTGIFLNTYENWESSGDSNEYVTLDFWDSDYPNNSTIFTDYNNYVGQEYNFTKSFQSDESHDEYLDYILYDDRGNIVLLGQKSNIQLISQLINVSGFNVKSKMFNIFNHMNNDDRELRIYSVSLINSSCSDLTVIPSFYDSREYGLVTPVGNQLNAGNCWAFAGIATLETCIKKATGITYDFSEINAKDIMSLFSAIGLNLNTNEGGYDSMIMAYLNSWLGPVEKGDELYESYSVLSLIYYPLFHVQNIKFLPARKNSSDNDLIKRAIMDYGAVSITFNWPGAGYHAVSLVGWDDNYNNKDSLGSYTKGAWIFKNSWGDEWGDNGFGYLSYDTMLASDYNDFCHAYTFIFNKNDGYAYNYQYDDAGVSDYLCGDGHVYYANKFVAVGGEIEDLVAFSTYFKYPTDYKVSVYKNNELVLSQSGYSDAGYYTIPFNETIDIFKGDEFMIIVENCNPGENFVPVCQADELNHANFETNNSFVSFDGEHWFDLFDLEGYHEFLYGGVKSNTCQVACIKAFTSLKFGFPLKIEVTEFDSIDVDEKITINITGSILDNRLVTVTINGKDYYAVSHDDKASLEVSFDEGGIYKLSAQYKNNFFESNIVEFDFKVNKQNTVISASSVSKVYGTGGDSVITLKDDNGNLIRDAVVIFALNGQTTKIKTNANGQAIVPITLAPKTYTATVTYGGSGRYNGATAQVNIFVKKVSAKITAKKLTLKAKKTKKYTILLKDNWGKAIKKVYVTLKVKGKTYKATTNAKGKATFRIKNLKKKGKFKATVKFAGNAYYNAVSKKVQIVVKK